MIRYFLLKKFLSLDYVFCERLILQRRRRCCVVFDDFIIVSCSFGFALSLEEHLALFLTLQRTFAFPISLQGASSRMTSIKSRYILAGLVFAIFSLAAAASLSYRDVVVQEWNAFKALYKKNYYNESVDKFRLSVFTEVKKLCVFWLTWFHICFFLY